WMRNPDHLVAALLLKVEEGDRDLLAVVQRILDEREPELRRVPMQKYLRGAWEPVDTSMAVLVTNGLAYYERVKAEPGDKTLKHSITFCNPGMISPREWPRRNRSSTGIGSAPSWSRRLGPMPPGAILRTFSTSCPSTPARRWARRLARLPTGFGESTRASPRGLESDLGAGVRSAGR
ncbi:MAG TPA: hypothetical protein VHS74_19330, partial [Solirubrobacterales bacterium]|nr:hypothetical protein [Solirubrobacterales bacterium]